MNVPLLIPIKEKILTEPENFQMPDWECGTAYCIAGWAVKLSGQEKLIERNKEGLALNYSIVAKDVLGLNTANYWDLFDASHWYRLGVAYDHDDSPEERANAGALAIDAFIKRYDKR